jgi:hypothetical protein
MPEKIAAAETAKFMKGKPGNIQECRSEAVETEGRRGFSQTRATQAYPQRYVEENEREKPRRTRGSADAAGIHEDSRAKATCRGSV